MKDCQNTCKDYYFDRDKKECIFKRMCIALNLEERKE